jgi:hypothetical protein
MHPIMQTEVPSSPLSAAASLISLGTVLLSVVLIHSGHSFSMKACKKPYRLFRRSSRKRPDGPGVSMALLCSGKRLGAFVGVSGWLPFARQMEGIVKEHEGLDAATHRYGRISSG